MLLNFSQQGACHQNQGNPVILLHGLFGSLSNLGNLARALSEQFLVYALDLRNHGDSPHHNEMSYADMAADVLALLDNQGIEKASFVGHSMGGKVAMQLALNQGERVDGLIVADIAPAAYPPHHNEILDGLDALANTAINSRKQADEILSQYVKEPGVRAFLLKNLAADGQGGYRLHLNLNAIKNNYDLLTGAVKGVPFTGPTLFLKGEDSAYIQEKHRPIITELFPNSQVKVMPGCGHWLHAENPDLFNKLVLDFFQDRLAQRR